MTQRVAVTGAAGQLGRQLVAAFERAGDEVLPLSRPLLDLADLGAAIGALESARPDVVVHAAAWTDVDGCAREPDLALRLNGEAAGQLAATSAAWNALFVQISTNEVFDGTSTEPYGEDALPSPINPYGVSKLVAEQMVAAATPRCLILRTAWLFGPRGSNFVSKILAAARIASGEGRPIRLVDDEWGNPTWTPTLAKAIHRAVEVAPDAGVPVLHLIGSPATTRRGWAKVALSALKDDAPASEPINSAEYPRASRVPMRAVLSDQVARSLGIGPLDWQQATADYARTLITSGAPA